jgi:hypothetical protein
MNSIKVSVTDPLVKRIVMATFPSYRGRKISIVPQRYPLNCKSYWDGGSRDYFAFLRLDTFAVAPMPAQSAFDRDIRGAESVTLPAGVICVEHSIFCGRDVGIRIHCNPENLVSMLPATHPALLPAAPAEPKYSVVESKVWLHKESGRRVSQYGACPWTNDADKADWELASVGWTLYDRQANTVGCGRVPWPTRDAAQAQADEWNAKRTALAVTYGS